MRRHFILVLVMLLTTIALASVGDHTIKPDTAAAMPAAPTAILRTNDGSLKPLKLEPIQAPDGPLTITASPATNTCALAPTLRMTDGGSTNNIRNFNAVPDGSDPILSCMWGQPDDPRGYRTAWYKFVPDAYGLVSLSTRTSNYDTVLAVHTGACGTLLELACNDDYDYFTSRLEIQVQAGEEYYVEVADWHSGASGQMVLNLQSQPIPIDSQWQLTSAGSSSDSFRSRHAVVANGTKLYVIAGQTSIGDNSVRTPSTYVYDTATGVTQYLSNMEGGSDGLGYSNTTATLINGRIYMPAGYTGINDGTHWVYNIASDEWSSSVEDNTWADAQPAIFSQANAYNFGAPPGNGYFLTGGMTGIFPVSDNSANWAPRGELYFYSVNSNSWLQLIGMPKKRFGHVAAIQNISGQNHLCVAGGMGGEPGTSREVQNSTNCFNISQGTWSEEAPLNYARYFASSAVDSQGNWYVLGGYDESDNLIGITERYDRQTNEWTVLGPSFSVVPPRAWSRGAYVGSTLWIIGGEIANESVVNFVEKAILFKGSMPFYLPVFANLQDNGRGYDTFATARRVSFPVSVFDQFNGAYDMVNIYGFDVPSPRQPVRITLNPQSSGNHLDLALYTYNKRLEAFSRQPGTITEQLTVTLDPGRYFIAVERIFPLVGEQPNPGQYLLQVFPG